MDRYARKKEEKENRSEIGTSLATGVIALVFLIIGYQAALFAGKLSLTRKALEKDKPDTVFVIDRNLAKELLVSELGTEGISGIVGNSETYRISGNKDVHIRKNTGHQASAELAKAYAMENQRRRKTESFRFNPNTVSAEELVRLGFSTKQAQSIINYRQKGGRFRRKEDFRHSYVVADSIFKRLEPYIDIPLTDLNSADSAVLDNLPGIGGFYAAKIIEYREQLGGYSYKEQLMDLYHFDQEKFDALSDLVTVSLSRAKPFRLWTLPEDSLKCHPYINNQNTAHSIVLYRQNNPKSAWTIEALGKAGVLSAGQTGKLSKCIIEKP